MGGGGTINKSQGRPREGKLGGSLRPISPSSSRQSSWRAVINIFLLHPCANYGWGGDLTIEGRLAIITQVREYCTCPSPVLLLLHQRAPRLGQREMQWPSREKKQGNKITWNHRWAQGPLDPLVLEGLGHWHWRGTERTGIEITIKSLTRSSRRLRTVLFSSVQGSFSLPSAKRALLLSIIP
jgi:hypothetical protein